MADNKMGPNIQAGAGFLAKRVQKSLNRAQEKVLQRLGKALETKDEQFEQCSQSLNKQQADGSKLFKDVKAYHSAVKVMHESSKRLSQTLKDIYESDWDGGDDLSVIIESEDLLWNDYEEKISDQIVRTMDNYTSQFPEVKERMAKRGRKLVDYDSARHHLEALQSAKKKDDGKLVKAEEEFNKAQSVFEDMNKELRDELPVLYQSRIGCYVTVFQNISNLRDVFYKEMSVLNHELYNVMKRLETQHSATTFVIKGLNSKSKKRTSLVISNPIPCNTGFPADHVSMRSDTHNGGDANPAMPAQSTSEGPDAAEGGGVPSKNATASDSDDLSSTGSTGAHTPKRQSLCSSETSGRSMEAPHLEEEEPEAEEESEAQAEAEADTSHSEDPGEGGPGPEVATGPEADACCPVAVVSTPTAGSAQENVTKAPPVPAPRVNSFRKPTLHKGGPGQEVEEETDPSSDQETNGTADESPNPPDVTPKHDGIVISGKEEGSDQNLDAKNLSGSTTESHSEPVQAD